MVPVRDLSKPLPLIVFFHDGGLVEGDKGGPEVCGPIEPIVGSAYAVTSADYRLAPESRFVRGQATSSTIRGVSAEDDWERAVFADPLTHVSGDDPPVFLLHGCWGQYLPVT
jgi:hypothetical protein